MANHKSPLGDALGAGGHSWPPWPLLPGAYPSRAAQRRAEAGAEAGAQGAGVTGQSPLPEVRWGRDRLEPQGSKRGTDEDLGEGP